MSEFVKSRGRTLGATLVVALIAGGLIWLGTTRAPSAPPKVVIPKLLVGDPTVDAMTEASKMLRGLSTSMKEGRTPNEN